MIDKSVAHYKILEKLGEGGMGVVYKAEDSRLGGMVALKFLPPDLTRDAEAKERFIREAKAASSLQHEHICTIHDVDETTDGQLFIVMDYYQGETLREAIARGPMPLDRAIDLSGQIAVGLKEAHDYGIIHRDIKPENIILTPRGQAKILDFGLASLGTQPHITRTSTTLGTAAYMSPEQASGKEVDRRSDIWALGVIFYEMITGVRPFTGEYEQAVIYSILHDDPEPVTARSSQAPKELERIIGKALAKKAGERY